MNHDRLLTRVWDKKEKKMLYPGDDMFDKDIKREVRSIGASECGLYCLTEGTSFEDPWDGVCRIYSFNDRFIPMQCMGRKNKNNKLFYQHDIVKTHDNCLCTVEIDENMAAFVFQLIGDENCKFCCSRIATGRAEIIGNKFENQELLEKTNG